MRHSLTAALLAALLSATWAAAQVPPLPDEVPPLPSEVDSPNVEADDDAIEVLNRGPVHEAFADQVPGDVEPPPIVAQQPPEPINEVPPEIKPDDESIWIPGYFTWSDAENDFVWVSGVWRVPPPGRRWTPGYWAEVEGGWQWIAGFWTEAEAEQLNYLPYPPESLDRGPTSPAPATDSYWVSGCWQWQTTGYAWQPGYWNTYRSGWTWCPHRYVWSPRGVLFVRGYWDYPLAGRGLLFAPIRYLRPIYHRPGYYYRPRYAVRPADILIHLFVNTRQRHLYYGNYYGSRYHDLGYRSWGHYEHRHSQLPSFTYYQSTFRRSSGVDFRNRLDDWARYYDRKPDYRPARTINEAQRQRERFEGDRNFSRASLFTTAANELANRRSDNGREAFRRVAEIDRSRFDRDQRELSDIRQRRAQVEREAGELPRADRSGRLPGGRDQRAELARPALNLPNFLSDSDRRQQFDSQMRQLRARNLDRDSLTGRSDDRSRSVGSSNGRSTVDRSEFAERLNAARENAGRSRTEGSTTSRSDFFERFNNSRSQAGDSRGPTVRTGPNQTQTPRATSPFGSRDQRSTPSTNQLRERFQSQSRGSDPSSRFSPGSRSVQPPRASSPSPSSAGRSGGSIFGGNSSSRSVRTPSASSPNRSPSASGFQGFNRSSSSGRSSSPSASSSNRSSPSRSIGSSRSSPSGRSSIGSGRSSSRGSSAAGRSGSSRGGGRSRGK